ncbi:MAG: CPBP family intramembrane metalloprotease [Crocinitomicaceae bacterium]
MGLVTLIVFPIPTFIVMPWLNDISITSIFQLENLSVFKVGIGIQLGAVYAFLALLFMQAPIFPDMPNRLGKVVQDMRLNLFDCVFLSLCAGIGEELLFRSGVQYYLGPLITSITFVAIHGYLNPFNWKKSLYGFIVLPFILLISYGFITFGLWFAIAAHFAYDLVIFLVITKNKS